MTISEFYTLYDRRGDRSFNGLLFIPNSKIIRPFGLRVLPSGALEINRKNIFQKVASSPRYACYCPFDMESFELQGNTLILKQPKFEITIYGYRREKEIISLNQNSYLGNAFSYYENSFVVQTELNGGPFLYSVIKDIHPSLKSNYSISYLERLFSFYGLDSEEKIEEFRDLCEKENIEEINDFYILYKDGKYYYNYSALF